ncbi:MAG TPA: phosphate acyltransferase, partial [Rhodoferax sp.]|nr:phosphate acyltransferase [Rhodoferax sp.]
GVAKRPIKDMDAYRRELSRFVYSTGLLMEPVFNAARNAPDSAKRVAYAEGEDDRVLRAAQLVVEGGLARPILIGRPAVIEARILKAGLRLQLGRDFDCCNPEDDPRFRQYWETYHQVMGRHGVSPEAAKAAVRRSTTTIAALMVKLGDADAMLCGLHGRFDVHLDHVRDILGVKAGASGLATLNALMLEQYSIFVADTYVNEDPSAEQLADIARMAADEVRRFGIAPKVAFLSHSNYGSSNRGSARKMRQARDLFKAACPDTECDGEMQGDAALSEDIRNATLIDNTLSGAANILICPNLDSANILFNVLKMTGSNGLTVGPILLGSAATAHVLNPSSTVRRVVNMTALAVADVSAAR